MNYLKYMTKVLLTIVVSAFLISISVNASAEKKLCLYNKWKEGVLFVIYLEGSGAHKKTCKNDATKKIYGGEIPNCVDKHLGNAKTHTTSKCVKWEKADVVQVDIIIQPKGKKEMNIYSYDSWLVNDLNKELKWDKKADLDVEKRCDIFTGKCDYYFEVED